MAVTLGAWLPLRPELLGGCGALGDKAPHVSDLVAPCLALGHAVRICFSHSPAVKLVFLIIEDFV